MTALFMSGGPSHHDTFDMKPNAPAEVRGTYAARQATRDRAAELRRTVEAAQRETDYLRRLERELAERRQPFGIVRARVHRRQRVRAADPLAPRARCCSRSAAWPRATVSTKRTVLVW